LIDRLESISRHYAELEQELARPEVVADHEQVTKLARELAGMRDIVEAYREYREVEQAHQEARELLHAEKDAEMQEYLRAEEAATAARIEELTERLKLLLLPKDPNDDRDVIVEIQGAEGGDEAELFARDLQIQERLTTQIANWLQRELQPKGVGVVLEAEHMCMSLRGVQKFGAKTVTSALHGLIRDDARTRQEFLALTTRTSHDQ